jgi:hypothetical protein
VVSERNGRWGQAAPVPGMRALNQGHGSFVTWVSCAPAGSCAAGGGYYTDRYHYQGFLAVERAAP